MTKHVDGVYTRKDRLGYWITWNDAQGRRRQRKTHAGTLAQARTARAAELSRVEQAKVLGFTPPGEELFSEVAKRYLDYQKVRITSKSYEREKGIFEQHLKPFFTGKVAAIRRGDVQRYITKRLTVAKPATVTKELNALKHLFHLAMDWEIIPICPSDRVKCPRPSAGRVRYLQPTELKAVLEACPVWLRPIVAIAVSTGMRRSEILGLRWLDVDLMGGLILLPQTKNGEGRIVYLNKFALKAIRSLSDGEGNDSTEKLFPDVTPDQVSMRFRRVCKDLKIEDFHFHDLRHTAASWLRMQGADIHTVAQLLGHKDMRMAIRYQHLSPTFLSREVRRIDGMLSLPASAKDSAKTTESANPRYQSVTEEEEAEGECVLIH